MAALSDYLRNAEGGRLHFWCPGCDSMHGIQTGSGPGPRWTWNGDAERPTFSPSVLVRGHKLCTDSDGKWTGEWERDTRGNMIPTRCHSFVRNGQIQFLGDCTHALAGKTVPLPAWAKGHNAEAQLPPEREARREPKARQRFGRSNAAICWVTA